MKILSKSGDTVKLLAFPDEEALERGDYLVIEDNERKLLVQVIDVEYADLPGMLEDTLRELSSEDAVRISMIDPYSIGSWIARVREARLIIAKFRGILVDGELRSDLLWLPSRLHSKIYKASPKMIAELSRTGGSRAIVLGECMSDWFTINAEALDGRLTIITGKKEMGKSHLAKLLIASLVEYGARVVVFDINGEYAGLAQRIDGSKTWISERILVLYPGENFRVSVEEAGIRTLHDILRHVYDTPPSTMREFSRIWHLVERAQGRVTLRGLIDAVSKTPMNESVREALQGRLYSMESLGFFDDESGVSIDGLLNSLEYGGALVINLSRCLSIGRRVVVEYLLSKLSSALRGTSSLPLFLVAEEAHLYLRETYWDDLVTRMRHIGVFPIFVTNQPDMIPDSVYRQSDNIFLFNFTNDSDLEYLSKATRVDGETVKRIVKTLPPRRCLIVGRVVNDLPVVVKVRDLPFRAMGETRLFFTPVKGR